MDLRKFSPTVEQQATAVGVLNYQPFIVSDDFQTGVAYSWLYGAEGGRLCKTGEFVWNKNAVPAEDWAKFTDANARLRAMYEDWLDDIAKMYKGGTIIDPACNNGYFLTGALLRGMKAASCYDRENYSKS